MQQATPKATNEGLGNSGLAKPQYVDLIRNALMW